MKLEGDDLKHLQAVCLELLEEVDRVCRKNHIEYTLDGGTLLGAVREKGFIPWDDDADVAFSRKEYEKFYIACQKDLNTEKYFLQEYRTDPEYAWGYAKLRRKDSKLIQVGQEHLKQQDGIFIDLFIYDPVPDNLLLRRLHLFACYCIRKCQYSVVGKVTAPNAFLRRFYRLLNRIPREKVFSALNRLVRWTYDKKTKLASHKTYPYFRKSCKFGLPAHCFDDYTEGTFEGKSFRIMKDYDSYLSALYGDYMTPPPAQQRKFYPVSEIRFPTDKR